jgi:hypothetical protein
MQWLHYWDITMINEICVASVLLTGAELTRLEALAAVVAGAGHQVQVVLPLDARPDTITIDPNVLVVDYTTGLTPAVVKTLMAETDPRNQFSVLAVLHREQLPEIAATIEMDDFVLWHESPAELQFRRDRLLKTQPGKATSGLSDMGDLFVETGRRRSFSMGAW